ncbi:MAG: hypothetical protein KU38_13475 [Sulfurovum sp. FS08-3]|nr:MAG: hypothetical protein KU38_13475 [Sulfurovum sp. FS08-3]
MVEQTKSDFLFFEFHPNLSTGQETYLYQFASFYNALKKEINNDIVFCIDEGESTMHPNWQRQYIKYLTDFLSSNFTDKNIQIILTSHSPFLLSDLQKENVIFLEKYKKDEDKNQKEGNCKVLKDGIKKQTFGANIHTLLSDGFFMSDGLMGEFAKQTINKIIEDLKNDNYKPQKEEKERVFKIIQTIGEPFLKQKLLDMYYKKFDKEARKKELEKEKARIEEELKKYD